MFAKHRSIEQGIKYGIQSLETVMCIWEFHIQYNKAPEINGEQMDYLVHDASKSGLL